MQESLYLLKNNCFSLGTVPININFSFGKVCGETIYPLSYLPLFNNSAVEVKSPIGTATSLEK